MNDYRYQMSEAKALLQIIMADVFEFQEALKHLHVQEAKDLHDRFRSFLLTQLTR